MEDIIKIDEKTGVQLSNVKPLQFRGKDLEPRHSDGRRTKIILLNARTVNIDALGYSITDDREAYDCLAFERLVGSKIESTDKGKEAIVKKYRELSQGQQKQQNYYLGYIIQQEHEYIFGESEEFIENTAREELKKMQQEENKRILKAGRRKRLEQNEREQAMKENWENRVSKARGEQ